MSSVAAPALYVALELGKKEWKLGLTSGFGVAPWVRTVSAGNFEGIGRVLARARARFGVAPDAPIWSCYEAGRDGFWIHRAVVARGWRNRVVDSASIEVNRRARRTKTDRLDACKLVMQLVRAVCGEPGVWQEVRIPSAAVEAERHVSRERSSLVAEQLRVRNQIGSFLALHGCGMRRPARPAADWWTRVQDWQGAPLAASVQARIARAEARLALLTEQLAALDEQQAVATATAPADSALGRLVQLRGVATTSASVLLAEGLGWRAFENRRQVGGFLGFSPTHYSSGTSERDQGIRCAGNRRLQANAIQLAWNWVRWQPMSALTQWYQANFGDRKRTRRVGIVAVARKLLIALWRYITTGVIPTGAVLKTVTPHA
jgi:transposase